MTRIEVKSEGARYHAFVYLRAASFWLAPWRGLMLIVFRKG